ncbi:MAG: insulinase family protein, partial [Anaerolineaceae bacterium]|nr:insulinase family protein [Anaerolineaceae bacterium]
TNEDQTGESALPDLKPINHSQRQHIPIPGKTQLDLVMGSAGPSRGSEDYYAAMVGNNILGQFGMMGRIGASVRVKSGLAYYAYSSLNAGVGPGSWEIIAGTNPSNIDQTIHLIRSEIQRFTNKPVLKGELADVKSNLVGRLPLAFESNGGVASALINMERYKLGLDYYQQFEGIIKSITPEAILEVAKRYLHPEWLLISTAGTVET